MRVRSRLARVVERAVVHPSAHVHPSARLAPGAIVCAGAYVGPRCTLEPGCVVGTGVHIGAQTVLGPNTSVENGRVGSHCVLHSGVRIGADGFGFAVVDGAVVKKPQLLRVLVGEGVEIGAGTCIDRGSWRDTKIGAPPRRMLHP